MWMVWVDLDGCRWIVPIDFEWGLELQLGGDVVLGFWVDGGKGFVGG